MSHRSKMKVITLLLFSVLMISSCTPGGSSEPAGPEATATPTDPMQAQPTAVPATPAPAQATPMPEEGETQAPPATESASLPDQGPVPTGSSALHATDPDSVNLADGDPTLVEFFAFW